MTLEQMCGTIVNPMDLNLSYLARTVEERIMLYIQQVSAILACMSTTAQAKCKWTIGKLKWADDRPLVNTKVRTSAKEKNCPE